MTPTLESIICDLLIKRGFYFRPVDGSVFHGDGVVSAGKLAEEIADLFEDLHDDFYGQLFILKEL